MSRWWLIPLLALFLAVSLYQLNLPGLHYDEAFEVVPAVQMLKHQPVHAFRNSTISLFGQPFPLTTQDYIGALNTYGSIPFLLWGGITVISLRSYAVFVGVLTLLLVYGFTADLARNRRAGLAAVALLVMNPTFVFWTRQGIFVTAITAGIGVAAAWSWLRWWRSRRYRWAVLGAFLFGLGLYAKLLFLWLIVGLGGAVVLTAGLRAWQSVQPQMRPLIERSRRGAAVRTLALQGLGLLAAGLLGMWPLIIYNLQTGGTFKSVGQNAATSYYGVDNTAVLSNLATRLGELVALLNGGHFWYLGDIYTNNFFPVIFALAFIASVWLALKHKKTTGLIPFVVIGLVVVESIITVSALWITHFALIMVWPAIALAATGSDLVRQLPRPAWLKIALPVILALLVATDATTTWQYHRALTTSGGLSGHSDAIYDEVAWLARHAAGRPVVAMDWGLSAPVTYLTAGRITPIEVFGYNWGDSSRFDEIIAPHLRPQAAIFLWRAPDEVIFDRSGDFKALYRPLNLEENILEAFYERSGRPVYGATELVPVGTAGNKPK